MEISLAISIVMLLVIIVSFTFMLKELKECQKIIKGHLDEKTKDFLAQVKDKGKNATRDVITLDENFVKSFDNITENAIDGVIVRKDW